MKKYYYVTNGDGTTHEGFVPFKNGDYAEAPDWIPDNGITCGNALHVVSGNPIKAFLYISRKDPVCYEVEPVELMPERGGKHRCKGLKKVSEITDIIPFLEAGSRDEDGYVRRAVMENPNATQKMLLVGSKDKSSYVRGAATGNPNATKEILLAGSGDEDGYVRGAAMESPNATHEMLLAGSKDKSCYVRCAAKENLNTRGYRRE